MRDLHRARSGPSTGDALIDAAACDGLPAEALPSEHPGAVTAAASAGRWDLVVRLAALGFPVDATGGRSALHLAAGTGPLYAVGALVQADAARLGAVLREPAGG